MTRGTDAIAFYLPQYHPTPENDQFWGKGFTEWRHVAAARKLYPWHEQPHEPSDLGFYDLRVPEVRRQQIELAEGAGLAAFCFYHYWFNGKLFLHRPVDDFFADPVPDSLRYLLCWANENWTMAWQGRDDLVTIEQTYGPEDDTAHAEHLVPFLVDERYYRLDGRPVLLIHRPELMPDPKASIGRMREVFAAHGIDPLLAYCAPFDERDVADLDMDFMVRWNPNFLRIRNCYDERTTKVMRLENRLLGRQFPRYRNNEAFAYESVVEDSIRHERPAWPTCESVFPSWDNTPRRGRGDALVFTGSTPQRYERWLRATIEKRRDDDPGLVFINAWNEWAEGCHLEPSLKWGHQWLAATRAATSGEI